jgi:hypothetical protein
LQGCQVQSTLLWLPPALLLLVLRLLLLLIRSLTELLLWPILLLVVLIRIIIVSKSRATIKETKETTSVIIQVRKDVILKGMKFSILMLVFLFNQFQTSFLGHFENVESQLRLPPLTPTSAARV